jgi:hypothetical protein
MPDGVTKTSFTYHAVTGRLASKRTPNDLNAAQPTVKYFYTLDGMLKREDYADAGTPDVTYYFTTTKTGTVQDPLGRLRFVDDGIGTHTHSYVALTSGTAGAGNLSTVDGPFANDDVVYGYDWMDRRTNMDLRNDSSGVYAYQDRTFDTLGRLKKIVGTLGTFDFVYNTSLPRVDKIDGPQSVDTDYTYFPNTDPVKTRAQRLESIRHSRTTGTGGTAVTTQFSKNVYNYDTAGRITAWTQETSAASAGNGFGYEYNLADELTRSEKRNLSSQTLLDRETWGLDTGGNYSSLRSRSA